MVEPISMKTETNAVRTYAYRGVPLTPHIIVHLTKELFAGKLVQRQTIVDQVQNVHLKRGGLPPSGSNFKSSIDRALRMMQKAGEVEKPSVGYWKILPTNTEVTAEEPPVSDTSISPSERSTDVLSDESLADFVIGSGPASVYLYYLPMYRARAEERGEDSWPCKIGRTEQNPVQRVLSQAATALPEKPFVAVVFRTKYSAALEAAFHAVFTLRGLAIQDAPGAEWFLTSPTEAIALARVFDPTSFDTQKPA
jgi:hypothetical protein